MNIEELREYCLSKKGTTEEMPFDNVTLVFKVMGKMYALTGLEGDFYVNLKSHPEQAIKWREEWPAIRPGFYMNKKHWNTVDIDGSLKDAFVYQMIDHSYDLVVSKLTKTVKAELEQL